MAANSWATIKVPRGDFERHRQARRESGLTWAEYIDRQAPDPPSREDVIRQAVREELEAVLADADVVELIEDEPEPEPLEPLIEPGGDTCLICDERFDATGRAIIHVLTEHAEAVNERHAEVDRRRRENGDVANVEWASSQNGDDPIRANGGPVSFGEVPVDRSGSPWGNGTTPARECDGCGELLSKGYAKVFSRGHDGYLRCPDCASRSQRYSMDSPLDSDADSTDPANVTGSSNPNAAVPHGEVTPDG